MTAEPVNAYTFLTAIISRVRTLHKRDPAGYCSECSEPWPCRTHRICTLQDTE